MAFHIKGRDQDGGMSATRLVPVNAAVIAMNWIAKGCSNVQITDDAGHAYDLASFIKMSVRQTASSKPL